MEGTKVRTKGSSKLIPDERASRFKSGYKHDEKETVTFNPPLEVKEWEFLMECQEIATKERKFTVPKEKKDGKKETKQTSKPEKPKQD